MTVDDNGDATAVWEVTAASPLANEDLLFAVLIRYKSSDPEWNAGSTVTVTGSFAAAPPTAGSGTGAAAAVASASLPIPRFVNTSTASAFWTQAPCQTTLLFPFVSNQAGFDTGFAILNPLGSLGASAGVAESGICTLKYSCAPGCASPPEQTTDAAIPAGAQLTFNLSTGGGYGIAATPGFQGYLVARCNFENARGFAFISDLGTRLFATSFLALVVPDGYFSQGLGQ